MAVDAPLEVAHVFPATNEFRLYASSRACFTEADLLRFYPGEVGLVDAKGLITRDCKLHVPPMLLPTPNDTRNVISLNASMNWAVESGHLTFTPSIVLSDAVWWQHLSAVAALLPSDLRGLVRTRCRLHAPRPASTHFILFLVLLHATRLANTTTH